MLLLRLCLATVGAVVGFLLTIPALVPALLFAGVAVPTRAVARRLRPSTMDWEGAIQFEPVVGWKPKPFLDGRCSFDRGTFYVKTDADGWRGRASLQDSQIVVFGDSYVFGHGVDERWLFSDLIPDIAIKPVGAPGYDMVQGLIWMRQLAPVLRGKQVVWAIFVGNDLHDNLNPNLFRYRKPFVRQCNGAGDWEIVTGHVSEAPWPFYFNGDGEQRSLDLFSENFRSARIYGACRFLINEANELCRQAGARLAVMTIPWKIQLSRTDWLQKIRRMKADENLDHNFPDKKIGEICRSLGVPFLPSMEFITEQDLIPGEIHWNERGHRRIAVALADFCRQELGKAGGSGMAL